MRYRGPKNRFHLVAKLQPLQSILPFLISHNSLHCLASSIVFILLSVKINLNFFIWSTSSRESELQRTQSGGLDLITFFLQIRYSGNVLILKANFVIPPFQLGFSSFILFFAHKDNFSLVLLLRVIPFNHFCLFNSIPCFTMEIGV